VLGRGSFLIGREELERVSSGVVEAEHLGAGDAAVQPDEPPGDVDRRPCVRRVRVADDLYGDLGAKRLPLESARSAFARCGFAFTWGSIAFSCSKPLDDRGAGVLPT
jgi:hypothetical protein